MMSGSSNSRVAYTKLGSGAPSNLFDDEQEAFSNAGGPNVSKSMHQKQQAILMDQDESLERVGGSLKTLKHMSSRIGDELEEQSGMLDELGSTMASTDSRLATVTRKIAKLSHLEDDNRQCTAILVLLGLIAFLLFVLIVL